MNNSLLEYFILFFKISTFLKYSPFFLAYSFWIGGEDRYKDSRYFWVDGPEVSKGFTNW